MTAFLQIAAVRQCLGPMELSDTDICSALHFVRSEQAHTPFYFVRPPPEANSETPTEWHHKTAAQMLQLRQIYASAIQYTLQQCFEALNDADWNLEEALIRLPWTED
ncbi:unnamed protein product [Hydatigera taeniaeformis]|uniref:Glutamate--cysteine ligase n=1 Tax=Hydatigena taeniaeformis TaxID=6205 RepID=A0A0R3X8Q0_HYDTA|nr:unnamed protein product [Hydatigera taeniaeformis]